MTNLFNNKPVGREIKTRFFVPSLIAVLLCLSLSSCKKEQASMERKQNPEMANSKDDNKEAKTDSLNGATPDSIVNADEMKRKSVILRKTKAQYVIY